MAPLIAERSQQAHRGFRENVLAQPHRAHSRLRYMNLDILICKVSIYAYIMEL